MRPLCLFLIQSDFFYFLDPLLSLFAHPILFLLFCFFPFLFFYHFCISYYLRFYYHLAFYFCHLFIGV